MPEVAFRHYKDCKIYAATMYEDIIKHLVRDLKYHSKKQLAPLQAQLMYKYWQELGLADNYLIIPVPIHKNRKKERKYNHMDLVADEFSILTGYLNNKKLLVRTKDTHKQFSLSKKERIENIKNAFEVNLDETIDKSTPLLIIDDITASGITLEEIIKVLKKNGYNNITALALATPV